jgi:hypothetical protein
MEKQHDAVLSRKRLKQKGDMKTKTVKKDHRRDKIMALWL